MVFDDINLYFHLQSTFSGENDSSIVCEHERSSWETKLTYRASSNLTNQRSVLVIYKKETSLLAHSTTNLIELFRFFELCREREKKYILIKYLIHY